MHYMYILSIFNVGLLIKHHILINNQIIKMPLTCFIWKTKGHLIDGTVDASLTECFHILK